MDFLDAIFLFLIFRGIFSALGRAGKNTKEKQQQKRRQTQTKSQQSQRQQSQQKQYANTSQRKKSSGGGFSSILKDIQSQLESLENQSKESYAETVIRREAKNKADSHRLEAQVLKTESMRRKEQVDYDEIYEGMGELAEKRISLEDMEDYHDTLFGDDDEDSLFNYDSTGIDSDIGMNIDADWDLDETDKIIEILEDKSAAMDLKTAIVFSEILGKPVSMRK